MSFQYDLKFTDSNASNGPQDRLLLQTMNDALNAWSTYISGTGTLVVQLGLAALGSPTAGTSYTIAKASPTTATVGTYNAELRHSLATPSSVTALTTGQHVASSDIDVVFNSQLLPNLSNGPSFSLLSVMEHELAHGFGMTGYYVSPSRSLYGSTESLYDADVQVQPGGLAFFTGATAEQVYGGPVPLTSSVQGSDIYHVGATGTASDPAGLRNDLMYPYALDPTASISALDVAILLDSGVPISPSGYALIYAPPAIPVPGGEVQSAIQALFMSTVGRAATPDDVTRIEGELTAGGSLAADRVALATSIEAANEIQSVFLATVNRAASAADVTRVEGELSAGGNIASDRVALATGPEASRAIQAVFQATVGRAASTADIARVQGELSAAGTLASDRTALATSAEAAGAIANVYVLATGAGPTPSRLLASQVELGSSTALSQLTSLLRSQQGMNIVDARGSVSVAATTQPDLFLLGTPPFHTRISGFEVAHDMLQIPTSLASSYAALVPDFASSAGDTQLIAGASVVTLVGVDPSQLRPADFQFV